MKYLPHVLLCIYLILFIICAINPYTRSIWVNENVPVVIIAIFLIVTFKKFRLSNMSYIIIFIGMVMQTIGGYYTFSKVPFESVSNFFGFKRNIYDRVGHFTLGIYAFPIAEYFYRKRLITQKRMIYVIPVFILLGVAGIYEIIERLSVAYGGGSNNAAFLGSQGDKWDAQADMLADGLGAILGVILFRFHQKKIGQ